MPGGAMKLHQHTDADGNRITACGTGWIEVNGERISDPVIVATDMVRQLEVAEASVAALIAAAEDVIAEFRPQVVLVGTGERFVLAPAAWVAQQAQRGTGVEAMDTPAACRTFNVLSYEGRRVVAVLGQGKLAGTGQAES